MNVSLVGTVTDGLLLSAVASALLVAMLYVNPRLAIRDYPADVRAKAPPMTSAEKRQALAWGLPLLALLVIGPAWSTWRIREHASFAVLVANAFGVGFTFNVVDWLVLDWLLFCTITPDFVVVPGTEGMAGYKDYGFHVRGFLVGTVVSVGAALVIAAAVRLAA